MVTEREKKILGVAARKRGFDSLQHAVIELRVDMDADDFVPMMAKALAGSSVSMSQENSSDVTEDAEPISETDPFGTGSDVLFAGDVPEWSDEDDDGAEDDDELEETPESVTSVLGFDPKEFGREIKMSLCSASGYTAVIAVDLDGTLTEDDPFTDELVFADPRPEAFDVLKELIDLGCMIVVFTCRGRVRLVQDYLEQHSLQYHYINENPFQPEGTSSKVMADFYWDAKSPGWPGLLGAIADLKTRLLSTEEQ